MHTEINRTISQNLGWARGKSHFLSKRFSIDFDDVLSFALESIWKACDKTEDRDRTLRWNAAILLHRRVIDLVRKIRRQKRLATFQYIELDSVSEESTTQIVLLDNVRNPCTQCGTIDGHIGPNHNLPQRINGMCKKCYDRVTQKNKRDERKRIFGTTYKPRTSSKHNI